MSDTRDEAQQELVEAGMASGLEDALGSSFSSSFSPAPAARKANPPQVSASSAESATPAPAEEDAPAAPIPGMAEWKDTYESYVSAWQSESAEARAKAEATRKRIEEEHAAAQKAEAERVKAETAQRKRVEEEMKKGERLREELAEELAGKAGEGSKRKGDGKREDRERKVKEAWEMVKGAGEAEVSETVTDARGVMDADVLAGQAQAPGANRPEVHTTAYDPTTSTEPLPPSMRDASPPSYPMPSESQTLSRHSATSQAWSEISASPSSAEEISPPPSGSSDRILSVGHLTTRAGQSVAEPVPSGFSRPDAPSTAPRPTEPVADKAAASAPQSIPPSQPPSLTLSLFTMPSHLTLSRVIAVLGINLVLPFINGVMLGFGEIFAREVVRVGKLVYHGERSLWDWRRRWGAEQQGPDRFGGGRGVAGVGLSGSGGFP